MNLAPGVGSERRVGLAGVGDSKEDPNMSREPAFSVFTSESVTEGHPDKLADQISDAILDAILAKMSEVQREAFILCEVEGLSVVETARALGVNESAMRSRLHDARKVFNAASARLRAQQTWGRE